MVFSVHLQRSAVTGIINCPVRSQFIGLRSLKPAPPQWIWVFQESLIKASRRYSAERGPFRPYARTSANGEVYHFLRDKGFLIKVPASWRELHARGLKLIRLGAEAVEVPGRLGISGDRWREIVEACSQRVVVMEVVELD